MSTIDQNICGIIGKSAQPVNEAAWTEQDIINAILGAVGDDQEKLKKGLLGLKKGALRKVYASISGGGVSDIGGDAGLEPEPHAEPDGDEGAEPAIPTDNDGDADEDKE